MKENTSLWFKVFALCTAVGLGGAYVWKQQQKAAPQIDKSVERMVLSGSKSAVITATSLPVNQEEAKPPTMLPGSKSYVIDPATFPVEEKKRILMSGSKSGIFQLDPKIDLELPSPEKPNAPKQRTLLPGSKSTTTTLGPMLDVQIPSEKKP
jgi:hypothetical protein